MAVRKTWMKRSAVAAIGLLMFAGAGAASAQPKSADPVPPRGPKSRPAEQIGNSELMNRLANDDQTIRHGAIEIVKERIGGQPGRIIDVRMQVFKTLMAGKHYEESADLAWFGVVTLPHETKTLEGFAQARVRSLLAMGKADEALQAAKSLFNVTTMSGTSEAILLVAECLNAARPKDKESFNKFREEQMAGAAAASADVSAPESVRSGKGMRSSVLDSIKIDTKAYDEALAKMTGEDYQGLMGRGNLLLMADRVKDAREIFERMYSLASASELVDASEALARTIRAEDGTIGRANSWVSAIKPKPAPIAPTPAVPTTPAPGK